MISQIFILSLRGDKIIYRDYRNDIVKGTDEIFFRKAKFWSGGEAPPAFNVDGINFFYIKKNSMYFVCTTRANVSPSYVLELLQRLTRLFKDYCGVLTEESLRKNFVLVYELLDEVIDCGHVQGTSTEALKTYIFNEPVLVEKVASAVGIGSGVVGGIGINIGITNPFDHLDTKKTVSSTAAHRPVSAPSSVKGSQKNEIFVDILERVSVVFNNAGNVVTSEIDGAIVMKSFLAGNPELRLGLNEDLVIGKDNSDNRRLGYGTVVLDDCNFHPVVQLDEFDINRTLSLHPPDGEFTVMNYRVTGEYRMPFRVMPFIEQVGPYKLEAIIKIRADIPKKSHGSNVLVRIPVPKSTTSVAVDFGVGVTGQSYEYKANEKAVMWGIKRFEGNTELICKVKISLSTPVTGITRKEIGPISLKFEVPMHNVSGLQVRFLRIEERTKAYNPSRWVRYITQANSYVCRV